MCNIFIHTLDFALLFLPRPLVAEAAHLIRSTWKLGENTVHLLRNQNMRKFWTIVTIQLNLPNFSICLIPCSMYPVVAMVYHLVKFERNANVTRALDREVNHYALTQEAVLPDIKCSSRNCSKIYCSLCLICLSFDSSLLIFIIYLFGRWVHHSCQILAFSSGHLAFHLTEPNWKIQICTLIFFKKTSNLSDYPELDLSHRTRSDFYSASSILEQLYEFAYLLQAVR